MKYSLKQIASSVSFHCLFLFFPIQFNPHEWKRLWKGKWGRGLLEYFNKILCIKIVPGGGGICAQRIAMMNFIGINKFIVALKICCNNEENIRMSTM